MSVNRLYFYTIFLCIVFTAILFFVYNMQFVYLKEINKYEIYLQKIQTNDQAIKKKLKINNLDYKKSEKEIFEKLNKDFNIEFKNILNQIDKELNKNQQNQYLKYNQKYKMINRTIQKSIHKFIQNILSFSPYLLNRQLFEQLNEVFDKKLLDINIIIKNESKLKTQNIVFLNDQTKSKLKDGRELIIQHKGFSLKKEGFKFDKNRYKFSPKSISYDNKKDKNIEIEFLEPPKIDKKLFISKKALIKYIIYIIISCVVVLFLIYFFISISRKKYIEALKNNKYIDEKIINSDYKQLAIAYNILLKKKNEMVKKNDEFEKKHNQFIADSIHQIKTPLSAIMMNLNLIEMSEDKDDIKSFISQIKTSIDMLSLNYEELSYLSMNNTIEYNPTYLNISEVLQQRCDFFKNIALSNDKKIFSTIQSNLYSNINKIELERVIDNNIVNAIKYSNIDSKIEVSFIKKDSKLAQLIISSNGKEIKDKQKIFQRHYRENDNTRGHGLGLAITKEICDKYNIALEYRAKEGKNIFKFDIEIR